MLIGVGLAVSRQKPAEGIKYQGAGFSFYLPASYRQTERHNDEIVLTFENEHSTIKVYAQPTNHLLSAISYISYGNEQLKQGKAGFIVEESKTGRVNWLVTNEISYSRPVLRKVTNDRNHYREIHIVDPLHERVITFWGKTTAENKKQLAMELKAAAKSYSWNGEIAETAKPAANYTGSPHIKYQGRRVTLEIPPGEIVWGRFYPGYPSKPEAALAMEQSEKELEHKFEFIMDYKTFLVGNPFPAEAVQRAYEDGRVLMLTLQPFSKDLNWIAVPEIIEGKHDEEIRQWAEGIKELGEPIFVRPLNEMNGDWDPWCAWFYGKDTELYVKAWRHIVNIFRETEADNAYFVWNPHDRSYPNFLWNNAHLYYPGDDYVDWVGLTGYNNGTSYEGDVWREFAEIYDHLYADYMQRYGHKPFMITEFSCNEVGGNKAQWIDKGMALLAKNYGNIKIATWFDNQDNLWLYQLDSSPEAWAAFKKGLKENSYYTGAVSVKK